MSVSGENHNKVIYLAFVNNKLVDKLTVNIYRLIRFFAYK